MLLGLEDSSVGFVEFVNTLFLAFVCLGVSLCLSLHTLDLFLAQAARSLDTNLLLFAGSLIFGGYVQDTIGINIECNLNLRFTTTCRHNTVEVEDTDLLVLGSHRTLTLQHLNLYTRLVIHSGGKGLGFLGRDSRISVNHLGHHTAHRLDTEAQRGNIQQKHIFYFARQHTTLDGCTYGYYLVRVNALVRHFAEEFLDSLLDSRDTGRTTYEDNLINVARTQSCFLQSGTARSDSTLDQIVNQLLELSTGKCLNQVCRNAVNRHNVRQVDFGRSGVGQLDFCFLGSLFQTLHSHRVFAQIGTAVLVLELLNEPVDNTMVEVITAKVGITIGGLYLEDAITQLQY